MSHVASGLDATAGIQGALVGRFDRVSVDEWPRLDIGLNVSRNGVPVFIGVENVGGFEGAPILVEPNSEARTVLVVVMVPATLPLCFLFSLLTDTKWISYDSDSAGIYGI